MTDFEVRLCVQLAKGIAAQFGSNCEVVIHDLSRHKLENSIIAIENGHISGRKVGDGPSRVVLEALKSDPSKLEDRLAYLTKTETGKILKSSTIFVRNDKNEPVAIFSINYDITMMHAVEDVLHEFTMPKESAVESPQVIIHNVTDVLEELIRQSVKLVDKPVGLMTKEDKVKAIRFLNDSGAFLITKSGQRVCSYFGISKYTLYNYIDEAKNAREAEEQNS